METLLFFEGHIPEVTIFLGGVIFWFSERRERKKTRTFEAVSVSYKEEFFIEAGRVEHTGEIDDPDLVKLLNYFEHISILVQEKHISDSIVKKMFKTRFITTYYKWEQEISDLRSKNPKTFINYKNQVLLWEKDNC